ncbi:hypothetical protein RND81_10G093400 [Saponaria officinalis]|uniref:Uncharacterized protein n=1 Tax=Saponaria officinalis TaxID=3572 RepID=A0AAW1HZW6_SAPOF
MLKLLLFLLLKCGHGVLFLLSFDGVFLDSTILGTNARTFLPFLFSTTILGYMIGIGCLCIQLYICCVLSVVVAAFAFGYRTKSVIDPVLGYYVMKVSTNPRAGDILMFFLGSLIISFAFFYV